MTSNTKLSPEQKQFVKDYIAANKDIFFTNNNKVTIMVRPVFEDSRMFEVSISTKAPDEKKFRKSVGKYYAIRAYKNGHYVLMDKDTLLSNWG